MKEFIYFLPLVFLVRENRGYSFSFFFFFLENIGSIENIKSIIHYTLLDFEKHPKNILSVAFFLVMFGLMANYLRQI